jgi:hypothetical protein
MLLDDTNKYFPLLIDNRNKHRVAQMKALENNLYSPKMARMSEYLRF